MVGVTVRWRSIYIQLFSTLWLISIIGLPQHSLSWNKNKGWEQKKLTARALPDPAGFQMSPIISTLSRPLTDWEGLNRKIYRFLMRPITHYRRFLQQLYTLLIQTMTFMMCEEVFLNTQIETNTLIRNRVTPFVTTGWPLAGWNCWNY